MANSERNATVSANEVARDPCIGSESCTAVTASAIAGVLVTLVYLPVTFIQFGFLDDYFHLARAVRGDGTFALFAAGGRPLQGWLTGPVFAAAGSIDALRWIRLATVLGIAGVGAYLTYIFVGWGWRKRDSIAVGVVVATLPPFQVYASWAVTFAVPLAVLLAMAGARSALRMADVEALSRRLLLGVLACGMLLASMLIFQPAAMMFLVVVLADLINGPHSVTRLARHSAAALGVAVPTSAAAFALFRWLSTTYGLPVSRSQLVSDVPAKAHWFVTEPLARSLNLTQLSRSYVFAMAIAALIVVGMWLHFKGTALQRLALTVAALLVLPFTYLPNLLVAESWPSYRTQVALSSAVAILAMFSLRELASALSFPRFSGHVACGVFGPC